MSEFQETFKELLDDAQINCYQLSKLLSIPSSTLNGYLTTKYYPTIENSIKISKFFNCSLDYLFGLADDKNHKHDQHNHNSFFDNFDTIIKNNKIAISKALREMKMGEYNYYRWRDGKFPKTSNLIEIAKYFNVSIDYLIGNMYK